MIYLITHLHLTIVNQVSELINKVSNFHIQNVCFTQDSKFHFHSKFLVFILLHGESHSLCFFLTIILACTQHNALKFH